MSDLAIQPRPLSRRTPAPAAPDVDIVVPVHNEEAGLEASIRRLHRFLRDGFPFSWRIVIADNASTDGTPVIAAELEAELPGLGALGARGARVGRGPKRELISRGYNRLLRVVLRARFSDAQCGFKAVRGDVA